MYIDILLDNRPEFMKCGCHDERLTLAFLTYNNGCRWVSLQACTSPIKNIGVTPWIFIAKHPKPHNIGWTMHTARVGVSRVMWRAISSLLRLDICIVNFCYRRHVLSNKVYYRLCLVSYSKRKLR